MIKVLSCALDEELRRLRSAILVLRGCDVVSPGTPESAIDEMQRGKFDVLLLCHELGGENSDTLCETFRQKFACGRIVFIRSPGIIAPLNCSADQIVSADDPEEMNGAVLGVPYLIRGSRRAN